MAQRTRANYKAVADSTYVDNTTGLVEPADDRSMHNDIADSAMFLDDNFIDEDSFATDSATKAPSQQSVKAYVDASISTSGIFTTTVSISSLEILSLNSTPKQIVAAPGANKIIQLLAVTAQLDSNGTGYTTNTALQLRYSGLSDPIWASPISGTADIFMFAAPYDAALDPNTTGDLRNLAIVATVATGNPTLGNGTLKFVVTYKIIDFT